MTHRDLTEFWNYLSLEKKKEILSVPSKSLLASLKSKNKHLCSCAACGGQRASMNQEMERLFDQFCRVLKFRAQTVHGMHSGNNTPHIHHNGTTLSHVTVTRHSIAHQHDEHTSDDEVPPLEDADSQNNSTASTTSITEDEWSNHTTVSNPRKEKGISPEDFAIYQFGQNIIIDDERHSLSVSDSWLREHGNDAVRLLKEFEQFEMGRMGRTFEEMLTAVVNMHGTSTTQSGGTNNTTVTNNTKQKRRKRLYSPPMNSANCVLRRSVKLRRNSKRGEPTSEIVQENSSIETEQEAFDEEEEIDVHDEEHGTSDEDSDYTGNDDGSSNSVLSDEAEEDLDHEDDGEDDDDLDESESLGDREDRKWRESLKLFKRYAAKLFYERIVLAYRQKLAMQMQKELIEEENAEKQTNKKRRDRQKNKKKEKKKSQNTRLSKKQTREQEEKERREQLQRQQQEEVRQRRIAEEQQKKIEEERKKVQERMLEEIARQHLEQQKKMQEDRQRQLEMEAAEEKKRRDAEQKLKKQKDKKKKKKSKKGAKPVANTVPAVPQVVPQQINGTSPPVHPAPVQQLNRSPQQMIQVAQAVKRPAASRASPQAQAQPSHAPWEQQQQLQRAMSGFPMHPTLSNGLPQVPVNFAPPPSSQQQQHQRASPNKPAVQPPQQQQQPSNFPQYQQVPPQQSMHFQQQQRMFQPPSHPSMSAVHGQPPQQMRGPLVGPPSQFAGGIMHHHAAPQAPLSSANQFVAQNGSMHHDSYTQQHRMSDFSNWYNTSPFMNGPQHTNGTDPNASFVHHQPTTSNQRTPNRTPEQTALGTFGSLGNNALNGGHADKNSTPFGSMGGLDSSLTSNTNTKNTGLPLFGGSNTSLLLGSAPVMSGNGSTVSSSPFAGFLSGDLSLSDPWSAPSIQSGGWEKTNFSAFNTETHK